MATSPNYAECNPYLSGFQDLDCTMEIGVGTSQWWQNTYRGHYEVTYTLRPGNNLVSFPFEFYPGQNTVEFIFPPTTYPDISGIITHGKAASNIGTSWVGSLEEIEGKKGYWVVNSGDSDVEVTVKGLNLYDQRPLHLQSLVLQVDISLVQMALLLLMV